MTFDQIITFASHQRTVNFVPGAEFSYSNTGFNLLAEMVARVTGKSFRAWTGEHFFRPLGMANSHFHDNSRELVPNRAYGYERTPNGSIARLNNLTAPGSSSLFTTVDDMARWVMNFDDAKVGGRRAMTLSRTTGVLNDGTKLSYAFGMFVGTYRGQVILNHTGEWEGFSSAMLHFPDQRFGVVILANSPIVPASSLTYWIADIFLEPVLGRRPPPVVESPSTVVDPFASAPDVALSPAIVERYVGLYRTGPGAYVRISRQNEGLMAQVGRDAEGPMLAKSDTSFWLPTNKAAMIFRVTADGGPIELRFRARRSLKVAESAPPTAGQLAQFAGKYESEELGSYLVVEVKEGALVLQDRRHGIIPLTWLWKDDFAGAVGYMRSVEFVRDSAGQVTGCAVFVDERTRNIRFTKRG